MKKLRGKLGSNACVVVMNYDEVCNLLFEIDNLLYLQLYSACGSDFEHIKALKSILFRHYLAVEEVDYDD